MKLYLVRHGKANQIARTDELRPLLPQGIAQVQEMAGMLKNLEANPEVIYASPRVRAQETANIIAQTLGKTVTTEDACNFEFSARAIVGLVKGLDEDAEVMFVGHNPSMSEVVGELTGAFVELSTGAIACITQYQPATSRGLLKWLITPKVANAIHGE